MVILWALQNDILVRQWKSRCFKDIILYSFIDRLLNVKRRTDPELRNMIYSSRVIIILKKCYFVAEFYDVFKICSLYYSYNLMFVYVPSRDISSLLSTQVAITFLWLSLWRTHYFLQKEKQLLTRIPLTTSETFAKQIFEVCKKLLRN